MLASRHDRRAPPRRDRAGDARLPERHLVADGFDVLGADGAGEALEVAERSHGPVLLADPLPDARRSRFAAGCARGSADGRGTVAPVIVLGRDGDDAVAVARRSTAAPTTCCCGRSPTTSCSRGSVRSCGAPPRTSATWSRQDQSGSTTQPAASPCTGSRSASPPRSTRCCDPRPRPASRLHEGAAAAGRVELPQHGSDSDGGFARLTRPPQADGARRGAVRRQCVGVGYRLLGD